MFNIGKIGVLSAASRAMRRAFNPAAIKDAFGNSRLMQFLFGSTSLTPSFTGEILDEREGAAERDNVQPGRAYSFNSVSVINTGIPVFTSNNISFSFNVRPSSVASGVFFEGGNGDIQPQINGGFLRFAQRGVTFGPSLAVVDAGVWQHFVVAYDGANVRTWKNGIEQPSQPFIADYTISNKTIGRLLSGKLSDLRLFDRTLTESEVLALYGSPFNPIASDLHYKCDDTHPVLAYDSSGNENNGIKTNTTTETFHYEGADVPYSYQDEVGFTDATTLRESDFSDWLTVGTNVSISGGVASFSGATNVTEYVQTPELIYPGYYARYRVTVTVENYVAGFIRCFVSGQGLLGASVIQPSGDGVYTVDMYRNSSTSVGRFQLRAFNTSTYDITDVKIERLGPHPRDESNIDFDVLGNPLEHTGRVKRNGQLVNMPCVTLDGVNDSIDSNIPNNAISGDRVFYAEVNPDAISLTNSVAYRIITQHLNGSSRFGIGFDSSNIVVFGTGATSLISAPAEVGTPYRIAGCVTGGVVTLYVNGVRVGEAAAVVGTGNAGSTISIGHNTNARNFDGTMWNVQLYNQALTDAQAIQLTTDGVPPVEPYEHFPVIEEEGASIHGVVRDTVATLRNATTTFKQGAWAKTQDQYAYAYAAGFTLNGNVTVPARRDGSADAQGNPIGVPPTYNFKPGIGQLDFSPIAAAGTEDWEHDYEFDDVRINTLFNAANGAKFLAYTEPPLTGSDLTKLTNYTKDA